jgi:hypothetical protein
MSGRFADRTFALAFMDANPDFFPQGEDREYALVLERTQNSRTYEVLTD